MGLRIERDITESFGNWLNKFMEHNEEEKRSMAAMLCWALWRGRNELIWKQKHMEISQIVVLAQTVLSQWKSVHDKTQDTTLGLLNLEDGDDRWNAPSEETIKINTDAALFVNPPSFSFAMIARNHAGRLQEARSSCRLGSVSPEIAEAIGIKEALSWVKSSRWNNVVIETDCLLAVQNIRSSVSMLSYFGRIITECRRMFDHLKDRHISLKFVKRSANTVAHYLARTTSVISDCTFFESNAPQELCAVILKDLK